MRLFKHPLRQPLFDRFVSSLNDLAQNRSWRHRRLSVSTEVAIVRSYRSAMHPASESVIVASSLASKERLDKGAKISQKRLRLLKGSEVASGLHLGPVDDVESLLCKGPRWWRKHGVWECGNAGGYTDTRARWKCSSPLQSLTLVDPCSSHDRSRCDVEHEIGKQQILGKRAP